MSAAILTALSKRSHICALQSDKLRITGQAIPGDGMEILLYQVRTAHGLSAKKLAQRSGVSRTHILRIENGWSNPTLKCLCQLADAMNVDVSELYRHKKGDPIY